MHPVLQPWPSAPAAGRLALGHQLCIDELCQVLSDRVVIQPEVVGELSDVDGLRRVDDVFEDGVSRGVAERAGLLLECGHRLLTLDFAAFGLVTLVEFRPEKCIATTSWDEFDDTSCRAQLRELGLDLFECAAERHMLEEIAQGVDLDFRGRETS